MTRSHAFVAFAGVLAALAFAYFSLMVARPDALARVLLRRGYEARGWTEVRLATRVRLLGVLGALVALAAILLAIVRIVG